MIITTPFGINDFVDHKKTYYVLNLLKEINLFFITKQVKIIGQWICLVASKRPKISNQDKLAWDFNFLEEEEQAFFNIQGKLLDEKRSITNKLLNFQQENKELKEKLIDLNKKINKSKK